MHYLSLPTKRQESVPEFFRSRLDKTKGLLRRLADPFEDQVIEVSTLNKFKSAKRLARRVKSTLYDNTLVDEYLVSLLITYIRIQREIKDLKLPEEIIPDIAFEHSKALGDHLLFHAGFFGDSPVFTYLSESPPQRDDALQLARRSFELASQVGRRTQYDVSKLAYMCGEVARHIAPAAKTLATLRINFRDELEFLVA